MDHSFRRQWVRRSLSLLKLHRWPLHRRRRPSRLRPQPPRNLRLQRRSNRKQRSSSRRHAPAFLLADDLFVAIALQIEQCGKVGVIDADPSLGRNGRLGMHGHAKAGNPDHVQIIGAIADGHGLAE